jgi:hypothetical protein
MNSHEAKHQQQIIAWKERIVACRGSGQSVKAWCQQEGYSCKTYYRWEREVLGLAGKQLSSRETSLQVQSDAVTPVFEELPAATTQYQEDPHPLIAAVRVGRSSVDVYQGASAEIIAAIFKGLDHAK